ncbi:hypothetical protein FACS1894166_09280 [Bacilli bacterium]|nr:hypothetical protein FACS1894166_09280 [Bacilli bacterium]
MQQYSFVGTISGIIDAFLERYIISTKITDITNRLYVNPKDSSYTKHIVWGQVNLYKDYRDDTNGIPIKSLNNLHKITNNFQPGLYTIRGPNGSGKSLLFANIKKKYGDNVFLFPAKQDLFFKHYKNNKFSTGEALMSNIEYVLQTKNLDKNKIVLLDEWDANLDNKNADIIHKKLESIKNKICILQIRHRVDKSPTSLNNMKGGK